jgi:hypothetical protein
MMRERATEIAAETDSFSDGYYNNNKSASVTA